MNIAMNFHESYPIVDIEQNRVLANNGNIAYAYKVELPEIYSLSEADFEELHGQWFQALKSLPIGTLVHKQDIYQKVSYDAGELRGSSFLAKATRNYFEGREHLSHESLIFLSGPRTGPSTAPR